MLPDQKRNKILDRVKKLLALSTSSNVNEAATAAAAAQKLMLEHRLTEADVSDTQEGQMFELSPDPSVSGWRSLPPSRWWRSFIGLITVLTAESTSRIPVARISVITSQTVRFFLNPVMSEEETRCHSPLDCWPERC